MSKKSLLLGVAAITCFTSLYGATTEVPEATTAVPGTTHSLLKIGVINFRYCLENSKFGKQELARLEEVKKQLETTIQAKKKEINEMAPKFSEEYIDTLTPTAEEELKAKFSNLNHELSQLENQFYSLLNQAQYQIMGKLTEMISKASVAVAKAKGLDITFNEEACPYHDAKFDISAPVVAEMDAQVAKEAAAAAAQAKTTAPAK